MKKGIRRLVAHATPYILAASMIGCGFDTISQPTPDELTYFERKAEELAACHGLYHGIGKVAIEWYPTARFDGAVAWACYPGQTSPIHLSREWVNSLQELGSLEWTIAHEVCHCAHPDLKDGYYDKDGTYHPNTIDKCQQLSVARSGCGSYVASLPSSRVEELRRMVAQGLIK